MGCVVLCAECCLAISPRVCPPVCSEAVSEIWICPSLWRVTGLVNLLSPFPFLLSFLWRHHVLVLCLYECFNHFHGGRILYLCSCTILFFSARKSVMYEINQSHLFENKIFILNFIKSNAVPHRLVLNVVYSANPCSSICNNCQEYSALVGLVSVRLTQRTIKE